MNRKIYSAITIVGVALVATLGLTSFTSLSAERISENSMLEIVRVEPTVFFKKRAERFAPGR